MKENVAEKRIKIVGEGPDLGNTGGNQGVGVEKGLTEEEKADQDHLRKLFCIICNHIK